MEQYLTPNNLILACVVGYVLMKANVFITKKDLDEKLEKYMTKELCLSNHKIIDDMKLKIDKIYDHIIGSM